MSQRNFIILLLATAISYACYVRGEQNPYARYVASGLAAIGDESLEPVDGRELFDSAMEGMVAALHRHGDEHSEFLLDDEADPLRNEIRQQFGGIGARIRFAGEPPRLVIADTPLPNTPAARARLLPGDVILTVDERPTTDMDLDEALGMLRGEPGTTVRLSVQRDNGTPRTVELVREVIQIESILGDVRSPDGGWKFVLEDAPHVAQLRIVLFGDQTSEEFINIVERLKPQGLRGIVLDLRDNAGGALDAAVAICDLLLPAGKAIVETRGRNGRLLKRYETTGAGRYLELPLAVIVNQNSASAAEIVAACLQDHRRAIIVGERTYGKGTVQQLVPLAERSLLKLTWASFWRPSGANIHRMVDAPDKASWGVVPDPGYELPLPDDEYAKYLKYRSERDLTDGAAGLAAQVSEAGDAPGAFVDKPLELAVDYLRSESKQAGL
jgi:carboxyl-terminal processing protease